MKFIVHAGFHKTGTTSIQNSCGENRNLLLANGIYYPGFEAKSWSNHSIPLSLICIKENGKSSHSVASIFKTDEDRILAANKFRNNFKSEVEQQHATNSILISGEDISIFNLDELQTFKELLLSCGATQIEFCFFVRSPIDFVLSGAQELVRAGLFQFGEALRMGNLQKARYKIENFQRVFGRESVKLYSYDLAIKNGSGIIEYFFNILGMNSFKTNELQVNSSMRFEKCLLLSSLVKSKNRDFIRTIDSLLYNVGNKINPSPQVYECLSPLIQEDCEFLKENYQISWEISAPRAKVDIDLILFDVYLKKICRYDSSIFPKAVIMDIIKDISDLYPEISKSLSRRYSTLIN